MSALSPISGSLDRRAATHLLKRLTFGPTKQEINNIENKSITQALDIILQQTPVAEPPVDPATGRQWLNPIPLERSTGRRQNNLETVLTPYMRNWWLDTMCRQNSGFTDKMTFFYHSHFTTLQSRIFYSLSLYYQLQLFRHHTTGNLKELARKICIDNAMLRNLDGDINEKDSPNENFAREFFELYSIGKGKQVSSSDYTTYTEHDIKEAARIFTGYKTEHTFSENIDPKSKAPLGRVLSNPQNMAIRHDGGEKRFSHRFGNKVIKPKELITFHTLVNMPTVDACLGELEEFVDMVFAQKDTARNLCRKLYRFFVHYNISPEIEREVIDPLADTMLRNNYEMMPVLRQLFSSRHFFDQDKGNARYNVRGSLIKSPIEIMAGTIRYFNIDLPKTNNTNEYYDVFGRLMKQLTEQGLDLYEPYDVAGYTAYHQAPDFHRHWISSNHLANRYQLSNDLIDGIRSRNGSFTLRMDVMKFVRNNQNITDPTDPRKLVQELIDDLLPEIITEDRFNYFLNEVFLDNLAVMNWQMEWKKYMESGNDGAVRQQLNRLVKAILQSPEFQLS